MKFFITQHAAERFVERIGRVDGNLYAEILKNLSAGKDITMKTFDDAPRYILYLYEKYSSAGLKIIESNGTIFILKKREGTQDLFNVVTCYKTEAHIQKTNQFKNSKYSRAEIFIKIREAKKKLKS
jgi:hypothetical protein